MTPGWCFLQLSCDVPSDFVTLLSEQVTNNKGVNALTESNNKYKIKKSKCSINSHAHIQIRSPPPPPPPPPSMHALGHPFKSCDQGARPCWLRYGRYHEHLQHPSNASPSNAASLEGTENNKGLSPWTTGWVGGQLNAQFSSR